MSSVGLIRPGSSIGGLVAQSTTVGILLGEAAAMGNILNVRFVIMFAGGCSVGRVVRRIGTRSVLLGTRLLMRARLIGRSMMGGYEKEIEREQDRV